ncbi:MAG: hypothetical protein R3305_02870 [Gammaproteobacteria bacterium]|nr:hypothetical protein [Gammaproteobacteria bacterium]
MTATGQSSRLRIVAHGATALLLLQAAALNLPAFAQQANEPASESASSEAEELVVVGQMPLTRLRVEWYRAEDRFFATFNELNSTDEFDIKCQMKSRTGTRMVNRICRAKFYKDLEGQAVTEWWRGGAHSPQQWLMSRSFIIEDKTRRLENELVALVIENPELRAALDEIEVTKTRYESEQRRRCAGRILFCRK